MAEAYKVTGYITPHFSIKEMTNKLANEAVELVITPAVIEHAQMLEELRAWAIATFPKVFTEKEGFSVSSWFRTVLFNKKCGGASNSAHLDGRATDLDNIPQSLFTQFTIAWQVICINHNKVGGVEYYEWGMHFDSYSDKFGFKRFRSEDNR